MRAKSEVPAQMRSLAIHIIHPSKGRRKPVEPEKMATISALSSSPHCQICRFSSSSLRLSSPPSSLASFPSLRHVRSLSLSRSQRRPFPSFGRTVRAVAEEETLVPEEEQAAATASEEESPSADRTVSVPVSPSDMLTILFKARSFPPFPVLLLFG